MQMNKKNEKDKGDKYDKIKHEIQLIEDNKRGLEIQREKKAAQKERA